MTKHSDIKRLKNQISAYQSRLVQRAQLEDINAQLEVRKAQLERIVDVLQKELDESTLSRVMGRIKKETPELNRANSNAKVMELKSMSEAVA